VVALVTAIGDKDTNIRRAAATALGKIGHPQARSALTIEFRTSNVRKTPIYGA
jgi:HEAT repeat protein